MSWQAYVDTSLVGSGHINKAAIISAAGDSIWASSAGFTPSTAEMKNIADIYAEKEGTNGGVRDKAFSEGLHVGGDRYVATRIEERTIYARKGREGIAIVKTNQAILLGHHGEQTQAGNASATVEKLADYLIGLGY